MKVLGIILAVIGIVIIASDVVWQCALGVALVAIGYTIATNQQKGGIKHE